jgi:hypothetical protein
MLLRVVVSVGASCLLSVGCAHHPAAATPPSAQQLADARQVLFHEPFQQIDPVRWREIALKGRTIYSIDTVDGSASLKAQSQAGASILVHPVEFDIREYPWLSWRWRVERLVDGENLRRKRGSDASARVYVYFNTKGFPWQKRNLDYVWSRTLPVGTELSSAYTNQSKIIVVESGSERAGQWLSVSRNLLDDYRRLFGEEPPRAAAIGLMVDTDNTRSEALARFDDVLISRQPPATASSE